MSGQTGGQTGRSFNLHQVFQDAEQSTKDADPRVVAQAAFKKIRVADRAEALRQALDIVAPVLVTQTRPTRRSGKTGRRPIGPRLVDQMQRWLDSREYSPLRGGYVFLRDCTVDDCLSIAEAREALAEQRPERPADVARRGTQGDPLR